MTFRPDEIAFMRQAELGRLATILPDGAPQVSPVGFTYNEQLGTIDVSGYRMSRSRKYRNIIDNEKVAFVVDDIPSRAPWRVRCLEIRGTARPTVAPVAHGAAGDELDTAIIRITPSRIISFAIDDASTDPHLLVADNRDV
ncbi:PPOX class F420-dependent oxidoreductase [Mycobacteroides chelonae]|uniref:PPOX class F420-dependent oxidoreductase n=1 Tax=Mycobacteroides chelonae TaxID=1774 RepID=UPI0018B01E77|nr:PPOX class F420-dependent oxidoreductase [Mycobacteroides chelonae]MBF9437429.1 PPOX class F420-dependent oxidoreductase [Mycobacteroides chelonae]